MDDFQKNSDGRALHGQEGGSELITSEHLTAAPDAQLSQKRPKDIAGAVKALSDRRREISKAKDALHIAEREAEKKGVEIGRIDASARWDAVHESRHLVSDMVAVMVPPVSKKASALGDLPSLRLEVPFVMCGTIS